MNDTQFSANVRQDSGEYFYSTRGPFQTSLLIQFIEGQKIQTGRRWDEKNGLCSRRLLLLRKECKNWDHIEELQLDRPTSGLYSLVFNAHLTIEIYAWQTGAASFIFKRDIHLWWFRQIFEHESYRYLWIIKCNTILPLSPIHISMFVTGYSSPFLDPT